jgi:hypothetical protein
VGTFLGLIASFVISDYCLDFLDSVRKWPIHSHSSSLTPSVF